MAKEKIIPQQGDQVAFSDVPETAVWWDVLNVEGDYVTIREHGTDYVPQTMYASMVRYVRRLTTFKIR